MNLNLSIDDTRLYQIAALLALLIVGIGVFDFAIQPRIALTIIVIAALCQLILPGDSTRIRSGLISALSLCLLLRTNEPQIAAFAALLAISSKYLFTVKGQHIFNPTALSLVITTFLFDAAWISPGQWGSNALLLILIVGFGTLITNKASRIDVSICFLVSFACLCFLRATYLGDPLAIPIHQLSNGALLIFAFFMISDPRTTPRHRYARLLFASLVATAAAALTFIFYVPNGPILALVACAPLVPVMNKMMPADIYHWESGGQSNQPSLSYKGVTHA